MIHNSLVKKTGCSVSIETVHLKSFLCLEHSLMSVAFFLPPTTCNLSPTQMYLDVLSNSLELHFVYRAFSVAITEMSSGERQSWAYEKNPYFSKSL